MEVAIKTGYLDDLKEPQKSRGNQKKKEGDVHAVGQTSTWSKFYEPQGYYLPPHPNVYYSYTGNVSSRPAVTGPTNLKAVVPKNN
ncbi:hypothetical protein COLO4_29938 [Corchorus olitorius]|uniref:Uncharacterized protein n=1 Tax=Corchorus olitorius TaxID=93759 RepID=A0A1R3HCE3_9ROSI|nr:hypothetical protein COLO4_29938 [Corchorus olitorius]